MALTVLRPIFVKDLQLPPIIEAACHDLAGKATHIAMRLPSKDSYLPIGIAIASEDRSEAKRENV
jgi:hypothetical protein